MRSPSSRASSCTTPMGELLVAAHQGQGCRNPDACPYVKEPDVQAARAAEAVKRDLWCQSALLVGVHTQASFGPDLCHLPAQMLYRYLSSMFCTGLLCFGVHWGPRFWTHHRRVTDLGYRESCKHQLGLEASRAGTRQSGCEPAWLLRHLSQRYQQMLMWVHDFWCRLTLVAWDPEGPDLKPESAPAPATGATARPAGCSSAAAASAPEQASATLQQRDDRYDVPVTLGSGR